MSLVSRLRQPAGSGGTGHLLRLELSSIFILSRDYRRLSYRDKSKAALKRIKAEKNPRKIVDICNAACLAPKNRLDRGALAVAVSKLAASKNLELVSELIEGLKIRPDLRNETFVCNSMVLYGKAKMATHAIRTFKTCGVLGVDRSVRVLNSLIYACILSKDYKSVNRAFVEFTKVYDIEPDLETYNRVIQSLSKSGSTSSAYSILADMRRKRLVPNSFTFQNILAGFYAEEKLEEVGNVINLMKKHGIEGRSAYNLRIRSLCLAKRCSEAVALLDEMVKEWIDPNDVTCSHLIHGFCKEGKLEEAKKMLKSMGKRGLKPESSCYITLVSSLCRGKDFDGALEVAKESIGNNVVPYFSTMKLLVEGLASSSKFAEARQIISIVKEKCTGNLNIWNEIESAFPTQTLGIAER